MSPSAEPYVSPTGNLFFRMRNVRFRDWKHKRLHAEIEKGPLVFGINSVHQLFIDTE